ncbi:MAG: septation regulator SpoVG [Firmicutes bacterium]|nr:septation regulator SpoVG [Candidatus Colimorpha enterica]
MQITDIKIRKVFDDETTLKAVASVTFDNCFVVHDIKVIKANDKVFIVMPTRRNGEGKFKDVAHPINPEFRAYIEEKVLACYELELELQKATAEAEARIIF